MALINWTQLGLEGPTSFAAAGLAQTIVADFYGSLPGLTQATISGGVILGSPSGPPLADPVLYGTASQSVISNANPSLQESITISFTQPVHTFSVEIFNGLSTSASYEVTDNTGDPPAIITLQPNSSTSGNNGFAGFSNDTEATSITITPVVLKGSPRSLLNFVKRALP